MNLTENDQSWMTVYICRNTGPTILICFIYMYYNVNIIILSTFTDTLSGLLNILFAVHNLPYVKLFSHTCICFWLTTTTDTICHSGEYVTSSFVATKLTLFSVGIVKPSSNWIHTSTRVCIICTDICKLIN